MAKHDETTTAASTTPTKISVKKGFKPAKRKSSSLYPWDEMSENDYFEIPNAKTMTDQVVSRVKSAASARNAKLKKQNSPLRFGLARSETDTICCVLRVMRGVNE